MDNICRNIEEYNPNKKRKVSIVFDDMIADMLNNKKLNQTVTELFIRDRKLNTYLNCTVLFCCIKNIRLDSYALFYYENLKQTRVSTKLNLIIHQLLGLKTFKKM